MYVYISYIYRIYIYTHRTQNMGTISPTNKKRNLSTSIWFCYLYLLVIVRRIWHVPLISKHRHKVLGQSFDTAVVMQTPRCGCCIQNGTKLSGNRLFGVWLAYCKKYLLPATTPTCKLPIQANLLRWECFCLPHLQEPCTANSPWVFFIWQDVLD